jgi:hypothetical protein
MSQKFLRGGNLYIDTGQITNTPIDMGNLKITTLADPVAQQDAVNLRSMNAAIASAIGTPYTLTFDIVLTNTTQIPLTGIGTTGNFILNIKNLDTTPYYDAPSSVVHLVKTHPSKTPMIHKQQSNTVSGEVLRIRWQDNQDIVVFKSGTLFNGNYRVSVNSIV